MGVLENILGAISTKASRDNQYLDLQRRQQASLDQERQHTRQVQDFGIAGQLLDSGRPVDSSGMVGTPDLAPPPADAPGPVQDLGGYRSPLSDRRAADPSRTRSFGGVTVERYTPDDIMRQTLSRDEILHAVQLRNLLNDKMEEDAAARRTQGVDAPAEIATRFNIPTGRKVLPKELSDLTTAAGGAIELGGKQADVDKKLADAQRQRVSDNAAWLAAMPDKASYTTAYNARVPADLRDQFPTPDQYDPLTTPKIVRRMGMTPDQQAKESQEMADLAEKIRSNKATEAETQRFHTMSEDGAQLTPDAEEMVATQFAHTGLLPPLGNGKQAGQTRERIMNRAAVLFPGVDLASNKADYQANSNSLKGLQKTSDQVDAFENTAGKNIDLFLKSAGNIVDTGSPLLNSPVRALSSKVLGSENMSAFTAARETALTEAAKVLESPQGGSALSVSGRESIKALSDPNATLGQQVSAMKVLRQDMANRKQSNAGVIQAIKARIGNKPAADASVAGGPVIVTDPHGTVHTFPDQASADTFKTSAGIQ